MSNSINKEKLLAGVIFGDDDNKEYVYMPGGELGSNNPVCIVNINNIETDVSLDIATETISKLSLKPFNIEPFSKI